MTDRLSNAIRSHAAAVDFDNSQNRIAIVASVDPARAIARVTIQPDGILTGWLPVLSSWTGSGWGWVSLPQPGDQVLVTPVEGDIEHGVILGGCYSTSERPPGAALGEAWLVHRSGSFLKLSNDGSIYIGGDLRVTGEVFDRHGSLSHLRTTYNAHTHSVGANATTGPANSQDTQNG